MVSRWLFASPGRLPGMWFADLQRSGITNKWVKLKFPGCLISALASALSELRSFRNLAHQNRVSGLETDPRYMHSYYFILPGSWCQCIFFSWMPGRVRPWQCSGGIWRPFQRAGRFMEKPGRFRRLHLALSRSPAFPCMRIWNENIIAVTTVTTMIMHI